MDDKDRMKQGFQMLLEVGLDVDDDEKYIPTSVSSICHPLTFVLLVQIQFVYETATLKYTYLII